MKKNFLNFINNRSIFVLSILLLINFALRVIIYFNTTLISFGDYKTYLKGIELIKDNGTIPLLNVNSLYLNSYIGYFFKYVLGNFDYYFLFNCLLGTLTSLVVYFICVKLTKNKGIGILAVFMHCIYLEFLVFSSIFYTPIIVIFMLSIIILLLIYFLEYKGYKKLLAGAIIVILVNGSFYFKGELSRLWILLILFGLINLKKKQILIGFVLLGVLLTFSTRALRHYHILPYKAGNISAYDFKFFGHTDYGGDGGEGAFIYKENRERYFTGFKKYCLKHQINNPTSIDHNNFKREEVKKFRTQHPFKWVYLQFYKFCRFFGVVPEGNSFKILITGTLKNMTVLTVMLLVLPFAVMMLLIVITFNFQRIKKAIYKPEAILLGAFVLYYIAGSVFYGQYQERYRMPLMVCFLIPYLAWSLVSFDYKNLIKNKKEIVLKTLITLLILSVWASQAYHSLVVRKDRYSDQKVITEIKNSQKIILDNKAKKRIII